MQHSTMMGWGRMVGLGALALLICHADPARAQATSQSTLAQHLFDEAIALMDRGEHATACPKLVESQRLDAGGGTLLNLARCYEATGRVASAMETYREALAIARRDTRQDRIGFAEEKLSELIPRVPHLRIVMTDERAFAESHATVTLDGVILGAALFDTPIPVDPGDHRLVVHFEGREAFSTRVRAEPSKLSVVRLPRLAVVDGVEPRRSWALPRTAAWVTGGVGVAGLATGAIFGALALTSDSRANAACPGTSCADLRGLDASDRAHGFATVSTVAIVAGAALVVTGVVLLVTTGQPMRTGLMRSFSTF